MAPRALCGALLLLLASGAQRAAATCSNSINGVVETGDAWTDTASGVYIHGCNNTIDANGTAIDGSDNIMQGNHLPAGYPGGPTTPKNENDKHFNHCQCLDAPQEGGAPDRGDQRDQLMRCLSPA